MQRVSMSLQAALIVAGIRTHGHGTVYYRKDGNRAVYDVTSPTEATAIANGVALQRDGKPIYSACWQVAVVHFQLYKIDLATGWSPRP